MGATATGTMPVIGSSPTWQLGTRLGKQFLALALLLIPAAILAFADELGAYFVGSRIHVGFHKDPLTNGVSYLIVTAALAGIARVAHASLDMNRRTNDSEMRVIQPGDPFATRLVILVFCNAFITLLFGLIFGYLAIGATYPATQSSNVELIRERAEALFGQRISQDEPLEVLSISGFAVSTYEIRTIPRPSPTAPNNWIWSGATYEEYGFPLRCLRTPIDIGIPRPSLHRLFFDPNEDHFIWTQLTNIQLLPIEFGINTVTFAAIVAIIYSGPTLILRAIKRRNLARLGRCVHCGYILNGLVRCPECGQTAGAKDKA